MANDDMHSLRRRRGALSKQQAMSYAIRRASFKIFALCFHKGNVVILQDMQIRIFPERANRLTEQPRCLAVI